MQFWNLESSTEPLKAEQLIPPPSRPEEHLLNVHLLMACLESAAARPPPKFVAMQPSKSDSSTAEPLPTKNAPPPSWAEHL